MKRRLWLVSAFVALLLTISAVPFALALDEPDRLWLVGEHAATDGLYPVARRTLEKFVTQYPRDSRIPEATLLLGRARLMSGQTELALEAFRRAQIFRPPPGRPLEPKFWEAEALVRLKRFTEARAAYEAILRKDATSPLAPDALYGLAWTEREMKRPEPAVTQFREFLKAWPEHPLAPAATLHLAETLIDAKRPKDALSLLETFETKYPNNKLVPDAQFLLGRTRVATGDPSAGLSDLQTFVSTYPTHPRVAEARRLIGQTLVRHGNRSQLQDEYRRLMAQTPPTAEALSVAAEIAGRLGHGSDQEAARRKLRTLFPDDALARRETLEMARAAFKRKDWKTAVAMAEDAAKSDDDAVKSEAWLLVGESNLKLKRLPPAVKAFEAVTAIKSAEAEVRYRALAGLGLAHEEQRELRAALTAYESVATRSPDATLREWARARADAVRSQLDKAPPKPAESKSRSRS